MLVQYCQHWPDIGPALTVTGAYLGKESEPDGEEGEGEVEDLYDTHRDEGLTRV